MLIKKKHRFHQNEQNVIKLNVYFFLLFLYFSIAQDYTANKRNRENFETTFDANGTIETSVQDVLPAKLEFRESSELQLTNDNKSFSQI